MARQRKRGVIIGIVDLIVLIITVGAVIALAGAYLSPYVNPNKIWYFAFLGLFFPLIYICNVILMLYWAVRWSKVFFLSALVCLIGIGSVSSFFKFSLSKKYEQPAGEESLDILTYNVAGFWHGETDEKKRNTVKDILSFVKERNPDVICFQEFASSKNYPGTYFDAELAEWKYKAMNGGLNTNYKLITYSKYPIISTKSVTFDGNYNGALITDIKVGNDTLRLLNSHLQITYVDRDNVAFLDAHNFGFDDETKAKFRQIAGRLKRGFSMRAFQADSLASEISGRNIPTIVCGDFNDTPMSYVYRTIRNDFNDAFEEKGRGFGYTYNMLYKVLRIDFVLHSGDFRTVSYDSPSLKWSDHNPVIARVKFREE